MTEPKPAQLGIDEIIGDKRAQIMALAAHYGATDVRVFGSAARGQARSDGDLDLLVSFPKGYKLRDLIRLT